MTRIRTPARTRTRALLTLLAATLLLLAAPAPPQARAASRAVTMAGYAFTPSSLTIAAGDTVTWTNHDTAPHDVKTTSGPVAIHSAMLSKGGTWSYTFTTPGTYSYVCTVHAGMTATIVVTAPPTHSAHSTRPAEPTRTHASTHPAIRTHKKTPTTAAAVHTSATPSADTSSPAAAAPGTPAGPAATAPAQVAADPAAATRPLQPLLLLAGLVSGVAVFCLLLVGSRAHQQRAD